MFEELSDRYSDQHTLHTGKPRLYNFFHYQWVPSCCAYCAMCSGVGVRTYTPISLYSLFNQHQRRKRTSKEPPLLEVEHAWLAAEVNDNQVGPTTTSTTGNWPQLSCFWNGSLSSVTVCWRSMTGADFINLKFASERITHIALQWHLSKRGPLEPETRRSINIHVRKKKMWTCIRSYFST